MKKAVLVISLVLFSLTSCQKQAEKEEKNNDTTTVVNDSASSSVSDVDVKEGSVLSQKI